MWRPLVIVTHRVTSHICFRFCWLTIPKFGDPFSFQTCEQSFHMDMSWATTSAIHTSSSCAHLPNLDETWHQKSLIANSLFRPRLSSQILDHTFLSLHNHWHGERASPRQQPDTPSTVPFRCNPCQCSIWPQQIFYLQGHWISFMGHYFLTLLTRKLPYESRAVSLYRIALYRTVYQRIFMNSPDMNRVIAFLTIAIRLQAVQLWSRNSESFTDQKLEPSTSELYYLAVTATARSNAQW